MCRLPSGNHNLIALLRAIHCRVADFDAVCCGAYPIKSVFTVSCQRVQQMFPALSMHAFQQQQIAHVRHQASLLKTQFFLVCTGDCKAEHPDSVPACWHSIPVNSHAAPGCIIRPRAIFTLTSKSCTRVFCSCAINKGGLQTPPDKAYKGQAKC